ncbi:MAG TPA: hypothetical protein VFV67_34090 [Actinophytocola sp.]|uniref:hypothetical protein n=1 Tax=Actinophytocola sp. TaxID=1872138 RepID=UPI002DB7A054|nr:hypothetical protein [Actinophytocola sp.]HEU5475699.1 hypothetical protein [Actinophytocola sp.]
MTAPTPPATGAPADGAPQPPAPAPVPQPPAAGPPAQPPADPAGDKPADDGAKFTQADLDRIINDRLTRAQQSWQAQQAERDKKIAALFGGAPADGDSALTAEQVLEQAQQITQTARDEANHAKAEALALAAKIKPERLDTFVKLVDLRGALADVDGNDATAVRTAIKAAVDAKVAEFPEWKTDATPPLPGASTANPNGAPGTPTLDQQIAKAEAEKNWRVAINLKRQRAAQQSG